MDCATRAVLDRNARFRGVTINIHVSRTRERRGGRMNTIVEWLSSAATQSSRRCGPLLLCGALAALIAGCQTPQYPPAPMSSVTPDFDYHIGPLDTVNVIVWRNPELSM